jgi:hypothetical protein
VKEDFGIQSAGKDGEHISRKQELGVGFIMPLPRIPMSSVLSEDIAVVNGGCLLDNCV